MTTTQTRRPVRWNDEVDAYVLLTDDQLAAEGWTRLPNGSYTKG